jgi:hypothetical protein
MKKLLLVILFSLLTANAYADSKVSALGSVNPTNADTVYVIQGGVSSKATVSNFFAAATDLDANGVIAANSVALGADTTGNYLATLADSGSGEVTVANSGSETAAVTLAIGTGISRTGHRHEGQVLGVSGLGATTVSGNTVSGNSITPGGAYTLPSWDGTNGYVMKTNGSGYITWQADNNSGGSTPGLDSLSGYSTTKVLQTGGIFGTTVSGNTVSGNTVNIGGFGRISAYQSKSFVLLSPTAGVTYNTVKFPYAITLRKIDVLCQGGAAGSTRVLGGLDEGDANGAYTASIDSDIAALSGTNYSDDGSLTNPSLDAGDYLNWHTSGVTGTVTAATVIFLYTIDAGTQIP